MIDDIRAIIATWFLNMALMIHEETYFEIIDGANASENGGSDD